MAMDEEEFDDIPTLSDIVFPGNPEKIIEKREDINTITAAPTRNAPHRGTIEESEQSDNVDIQDEVDKIVQSVLAKYFFKARQEIVEEIMRELHKKIP